MRKVAPWAMLQVQAWERTVNEGEAIALRSPHVYLLLLPSCPPLSLGCPQYQIDSKAQVAHSQNSYKAKVGGVREAGQVADHKVEVDGTDQCHDAGSDDFAQPAG